MTPPRVSIAALCVAVAVVAVDVAWMRHVDATKKSLLGFRGWALDAGFLPMAGLLAMDGALLLLARRRPARRDLARIAGRTSGIALYLIYNYACVYLDAHGGCRLVELSLSPIDHVKGLWHLSSEALFYYAADAVYFTPPQLIAAAAVAALVRRGGRAPAPAAIPEESR